MHFLIATFVPSSGKIAMQPQGPGHIFHYDNLPPHAKVEFVNDLLPTASPCHFIMRVPTAHHNYQQFKYHLELAINGNDGFGNIWCCFCCSVSFVLCLVADKQLIY